MYQQSVGFTSSYFDYGIIFSPYGTNYHGVIFFLPTFNLYQVCSLRRLIYGNELIEIN